MPIYTLDGVTPELPQANDYWLAPDAVLIGRVRLERGASVWFGSVLRGDHELIHIGEGSNIQERCVFHTDLGSPLTVGAGCTIGHCVILHGCDVADHSLIGMGSTILNGARIGRNCIVGANSLVTEGKVIPDNSLAIGSPARVVREITEAEAASIRHSAEAYRDNWRRFAEGLRLA